LRSVIASLDQRYREEVHHLEKVPLIVREPPEACAVCGSRMNVQKTIERWEKTLAHGLFRVRETIYACVSGRRKGHRVTARSPFWAQLLLPHSTVGTTCWYMSVTNALCTTVNARRFAPS
jgi:hypothetical protein